MDDNSGGQYHRRRYVHPYRSVCEPFLPCGGCWPRGRRIHAWRATKPGGLSPGFPGVLQTRHKSPAQTASAVSHERLETQRRWILLSERSKHRELGQIIARECAAYWHASPSEE